MRWVIPFLVSLNCLAQLPMIPSGFNFPTSSTSASIPDYTNNLWVDAQSDTVSSAGSPAQGAVMVEWTNIAPGNPAIGTLANSFVQTNGSATWPYFTNNVTPLGKPAWAFNINANQNWRPLITGNGQPQPYTIFYVMDFNSFGGSGQTVFDGASGARTLFRVDLPGAFMNSGGSLQGASVAQTNRWDIWCFQNNGGTSVFMRTNNVDYIPNGSGTAGSAGSAMINLGNDNTLVTPFKGRIAAIRFYAEQMSGANIATVWSNLCRRYIATTPPR